jgi:glycosyltransferase involved in cell wall biosynthesis
VIPFFRTGERIRDTLLDIADQTFRDFEVLFVDDGSGDDTPQIIRRFFDGHPEVCGRLLANDRNQGVSVSRNRGLAESAGEYVLCCDSDDRLSPLFLEKLYRSVKENKADMAWCGFRVENPAIKKGKDYSPADNGVQEKTKVLRQYLKGHRLVNACNAIYRRAFLEEWGIRYPRGCRFAEDREFIIKALFHAKRVTAVEETLYTYLQHPGQSTVKMQNDPSKYAHAVGVYQRLLAYMEGRFSEELLTRECARIIRSFELPNALIKMICSFAEMGDSQRFRQSLNSRTIRNKIRPSIRSLHYKPEVFAKALLLRFFPNIMYRNYAKR